MHPAKIYVIKSLLIHFLSHHIDEGKEKYFWGVIVSSPT